MIKRSPEYNFAKFYPQAAAAWDYEYNQDCPEELTPKSGKKRGFNCFKHGFFIKQIASVANCIDKNGFVCSSCARENGNKKNTQTRLSRGDSIGDKYPIVIDWWDDSDTSPHEVVSSSQKMVKIKCMRNPNHGSSYRSVRSLSKNIEEGKDFPPCRKCKGYEIVLSESLLLTHPKIAKQWHPYKNGDLFPSQVRAGSNKKVWWKREECGHEYVAGIRHRAIRGHGCPYCSHQKCTKEDSIGSTHPSLVLEWNDSDLSPWEVVSGSNRKVKWKCRKCTHIWEARIFDRAYRNCKNCSRCASIIATHPYLIQEWDSIKNKNLLLIDVTGGSNKRVWWKCEYGHEWMATVAHRTRGQGCSECYKGSNSKSEFVILEYLRKRFPFLHFVHDKQFSKEITRRKYRLDIRVDEISFGLEYNGDHIHCNPELYSSNDFSLQTTMLARDKWILDSEKIKCITDLGYEVLTVWEKDFNEDLKGFLKGIVDFISRLIVKHIQKTIKKKDKLWEF